VSVNNLCTFELTPKDVLTVSQKAEINGKMERGVNSNGMNNKIC
jgi:hypothetical protein